MNTTINYCYYGRATVIGTFSRGAGENRPCLVFPWVWGSLQAIIFLFQYLLALRLKGQQTLVF